AKSRLRPDAKRALAPDGYYGPGARLPGRRGSAQRFSNTLKTNSKTSGSFGLLLARAAHFSKEYSADRPPILFVDPALVACSILFEYGLNFFEFHPKNRLDQSPGWKTWRSSAVKWGFWTGLLGPSRQGKAELRGRGRPRGGTRSRHNLFCTATQPR